MTRWSRVWVRPCRTLKVGSALEDLDVGPLIRLKISCSVYGTFLSRAQRDLEVPIAAQGQVVDHAPQSGFYPGSDAAARRTLKSRVGARKKSLGLCSLP